MIRVRTLVTIRRALQRASVAGLLRGADALVGVARSVDGGRLASQSMAAGGRRRESMRQVALRRIVGAVLNRPLADTDSAVMLAHELCGALERALVTVGPLPAAETIREAALRHLVEALLGRPVDAGEAAAGYALDLAAKIRVAGSPLAGGEPDGQGDTDCWLGDGPTAREIAAAIGAAGGIVGAVAALILLAWLWPVVPAIVAGWLS